MYELIRSLRYWANQFIVNIDLFMISLGLNDWGNWEGEKTTTNMFVYFWVFVVVVVFRDRVSLTAFSAAFWERGKTMNGCGRPLS